MRLREIGLTATLIGLVILSGNLLFEATPAMLGFEPIALFLIVLGFVFITHDRIKFKEENMKAQISPVTLVLLAILLVIVVVAITYIGIYNGLISLDVKTETAWADVETQYQRRYDLIPNLVNTAQGYITHERELLTELTELRSQWGKAATQSDKIETSTAIESAISRLLLVVENYPDLKAVETFRTLMTQLEGTENRIAVARRDYNWVVREFNTAIRVFPSNMVANMLGMKSKLFFESKEGAQDAPVVEFD